MWRFWILHKKRFGTKAYDSEYESLDKYMETEDMAQKQQFSCHYCSKECCSQDKVDSHMKMCTEDEDSLEEQNFKCPYCGQELISHDAVIKHMENQQSIVIIL